MIRNYYYIYYYYLLFYYLFIIIYYYYYLLFIYYIKNKNNKNLSISNCKHLFTESTNQTRITRKYLLPSTGKSFLEK